MCPNEWHAYPQTIVSVSYHYKDPTQRVGQVQSIIFIIPSNVTYKELNLCQTNTWYSSILLILNQMNISNVNVYVGTLCNNVKKKLCDNFLSYWYNLKKCINEDKN